MSSSNVVSATSTGAAIKKVLDMNNREYYFDKFLVGRPEDDVAVIIDGANLSYMTRKVLRAVVDYKVLSHIFYANFPGVRSVSYVIAEIMTLDHDYNNNDDGYGHNRRPFKNGFSPIRGLLMWMRNNRYKVISREVVKDSQTYSYQETSMDVEITTALYKAARFANHIVFIGSSAKFVAPLQDLHDQGKTITVIGIKKPEDSREVSQAFYTAEGLREIDNFVDLHDPFFDIMYKNKITPAVQSYAPDDNYHTSHYDGDGHPENSLRNRDRDRDHVSIADDDDNNDGNGTDGNADDNLLYGDNDLELESESKDGINGRVSR